MITVNLDFIHPVDFNFFRNFLITQADRYNIIITILDRGPVKQIVYNELPNIHKYKIKVIGKHTGSWYSIIFQANFFRFFKMLWFFAFNRPDIGLSFISFPQSAALWLLRVPNYQFDDDVERKVNRLLMNMFSTETYYPPFLKESKKIKVFNALKEWAYLAPMYFTPDDKALSEYNLKKNKYVFIREISTGSVNYKSQEAVLLSVYSNFVPSGYKVILSLEDKNTADIYPEEWIILREPVCNIHSLIYFSSFVVSSGDTVVREGAILGVPSIYVGKRDMMANEVLEKKGLLFKVTPSKLKTFVDNKISQIASKINQEKFRKSLKNEFGDLAKFIKDLVEEKNNK